MLACDSNTISLIKAKTFNACRSDTSCRVSQSQGFILSSLRLMTTRAILSLFIMVATTVRAAPTEATFYLLVVVSLVVLALLTLLAKSAAVLLAVFNALAAKSCAC